MDTLHHRLGHAGACVRACVRACSCACVRACACVCGCVWICVWMWRIRSAPENGACLLRPVLGRDVGPGWSDGALGRRIVPPSLDCSPFFLLYPSPSSLFLFLLYRFYRPTRLKSGRERLGSNAGRVRVCRSPLAAASRARRHGLLFCTPRGHVGGVMQAGGGRGLDPLFFEARVVTPPPPLSPATRARREFVIVARFRRLVRAGIKWS